MLSYYTYIYIYKFMSCLIPRIIRMIKSRGMRWAGNVTRMERREISTG
jgi:hypothetical protein